MGVLVALKMLRIFRTSVLYGNFKYVDEIVLLDTAVIYSKWVKRFYFW